MKIIGKITPRGPNRTIRKATANSINLTQALRSIENVIGSSVEQNFQDEGRPNPWKALKAATLRARARKGKTGKILTVTGQLKNSVNTRTEKNIVIVGSNKVYAPAMNDGVKEKNIPARTFLLFQKEDIKESEEILLEHLLGGLK